jgi:hypothetical protein
MLALSIQVSTTRTAQISFSRSKERLSTPGIKRPHFAPLQNEPQ